MEEFNWSQSEKKIAKEAFDKAYQNEMIEIKNELIKKLNGLKDLQEIWRIHDYLSHRRKEVDKKYDYRYSVLIILFGRLYYEGYLKEKDLEGLSQEKIERIKSIANFK